MSSRIHSEFGSLGHRVEGTATRQPKERFVQVDGLPGLLIRWERHPQGWEALCAWVDSAGGLRVESIVPGRVRPART